MTLKNFFLPFFVLILLSGCHQYKNVTYFYNLQPDKADTFFRKIIVPYKVQPADILYITIHSLDERVSALFNKESTALSSNSMIMSGMYILGNSINPEGNIILPVIGTIPVAGSTVPEIQKKLSVILLKLIPDAQVEVKLVSFKISVIGEVRNPGYFTILNDRANIIEALALAGDITYNGNKTQMVLMRSYETGTKIFAIDLTDKNLINSDKFYLQPNDIVYIKPLRSTILRIRVSDYSVLISAITASMTVFLLLRSLKLF